LKGVAVVGNAADAANDGVWQYSADNGTNWLDIGTVADDSSALALSAATRIRFVPVVTFTGQPTPIVVRAIDNTFAGFFCSGLFRVTVDASIHGGIEAIAGSTNLVETEVFPYGTGDVPPTLLGVPVSANINEGQTLAFSAS